LPHSEVIVEQQKSRVLLLLVNNTKNAKGILTGKFFEYMAAKTPVLAIGPVDGDLAAIVKETGCGLISDFSDEVSLEKNILSLFEGNNIQANPQIENYSRKSLTAQLSDYLKKL
jgi:hypothetical protein